MKVMYSFVVDGGEKFRLQTRTFISSLLGVGVLPTQILAQVTPSVDSETRNLIRGFGVFVRTIEPVLDKKYCNKIAQLKDIEDYPSDIYVLCDTDLAFAENISRQFDTESVRGKIVDVCRPPLPVLKRLCGIAGIPQDARLMNTILDEKPTFSTNCNGGLYGIPKRLAKDLHATWFEIGKLLFERPELLGQWRVNTDQVAFCLAMLKLKQDNREFSIEYNFPLHLPGQFGRLSFGTPKVLHYHMRLRADGYVLRSGNPVADKAVDRVNANLKKQFAGAAAFWKVSPTPRPPSP